MKVLVDTNILISFIVPTVPVGTPLTTLCVACEGTPERPWRHSHAERGNDDKILAGAVVDHGSGAYGSVSSIDAGQFIVPTVPVGMPLTTLCVACERTRSVRGSIPTQSVGTMTLANLGYLG
jgi:hypothetical protein